MKRFTFRLERLARVRRIEEERARAEWQEALGRVRESEARLVARQAQIAEAHDAMRRAQREARLSPRDFLNLDRLLSQLAEAVSQARSQLADAQAREASLREPWQHLRTEVEGLARLEDKARTRHRIEHGREESRQMDQIATERAARGRSAERQRS